MFYWTKNDAIVICSAFACIIAVSIILYFLLRKTKFKRLPLQIIACFVVFLEISKQIYFAFFGEFTYYVLPLHFCSLFIILFPLSQCFGKKIGKFFKPMALIYSILFLLILLVHPHSVLSNACDGVFKSFFYCHTIFFHFSIVFYLFYSLLICDYIPRLFDLVPLACGLAFYASYAVPCAYALKQNYVNILYSLFAPVEKIRLQIGQVWYDISLFIVALAGIYLFFAIYFLIYKLISKKVGHGN